MSARFEVVRTDGEKQWAAHFVSNGSVLFASAYYTRMVDAERAILSWARAGGSGRPKWLLKWNVPGVEKVFVHPRGDVVRNAPVVHYVDRRRSAAGAACWWLLLAPAVMVVVAYAGAWAR